MSLVATPGRTNSLYYMPVGMGSSSGPPGDCSGHASVDLSDARVLASLAGLGILPILLKTVSKKNTNLPPGPRPLPIVGNWLGLPGADEKPWLIYQEWSRQYSGLLSHIGSLTSLFTRLAATESDIVHFEAFGTHVVVINSQQAAKDLFDKKGALYGDRYGNPRRKWLD
ncbi:hypothetical protein AAF712_004752 [Marasmius tenuissimus]|uniref:Cytochrome P450 n=1 Tax=Marasmius tenuissimus TaxID=585030 RepID=A0ABR3A3Y1_9AGAR